MSHSETLGLGLQHEFGALWNLGVGGGGQAAVPAAQCEDIDVGQRFPERGWTN
jgi:hypothetical protein